MLSNGTKKKIDTARDILVGKIPMPTAQVEQITLALIYKFMADMDKKAKDLGDSSGFFSNGYEKYAWDLIMDKSLAARDRVTLYSEGLEKMSLNPYIPQLFRDIFRNAFLPFKDPETLKLFLDVIDQFEYDHSEELGNAFEYLLQVMGSQGDAGQFRTPRHIIDFIVDVVDPKKTDKILDPACGTAGFLISAYKHIKCNGLSSDEMKTISDNFVGYDISQDMQRLSLVNLYLHHFPDPHIYEYDTLTSEERWSDDFDVILANPPFMTPKGGIRPHNRFSVPSKRAEVLFVDYIMEHLTVHGKAGVIVPEGIIFQSQNAYKQLRKMMVDDDFLWAVVSLPSGVFQPYSGVKTSILLFDRELAKKTNKILFVKVENDGFDLGAQRRPIKKDDLPEAIKVLKEYKQSLVDGKKVDFESSDKAYLVEKKVIREGKYNLSGEGYKSRKVINSKFHQVKLGELVDLLNGYAFKSSKFNNNGIGLPIIRIRDINSGYTKTFYEGSYDDKYLVKNGDLLIGMDGDFKISLWNHGSALLNQRVCKIHNFRNVDKRFLLFMMQKALDVIHADTYALTVKHLSSKQIEDINIPLPPTSVQKEIVEELDRYQKIIDGAQQVVDNYQPNFDIEDGWEWMPMKDILTLTQYGSSKKMNTNKGYKTFRMNELIGGQAVDNGEMKLTAWSETEFKKYKLEPNDILFNRTNSVEHVGRTGIFNLEGEYMFASYLIRLTANKKIVLPDYLNFLMNTTRFQTDIKRYAKVAINQANISATVLGEYEVPIPSLTVQEQIVAQLEKEVRLVKQSAELATIFENKLKDRVDAIWGSDQ